ncbi:MAG: hypothetical protein M1813_007518 [Trichoglossum hirsutum]|nr:MAG: hypothetical protein M1813_007518 [Trichoglossum hirsutum]
MKYILITSLAFATKAIADGIYSLPEDAPDGIYNHYTDDSGSPAYEKISMPTSTPASNPRSFLDTLTQSAKFRRQADVSCSNYYVGGSDLPGAVKGLTDFFGAGNSFRKNYSFKYGSVIAFACDYGRGQTYTSQQFLADMAAVDGVCGPQGAGWNSHKSAKSSYGRTQSSQSFC